MGVSPLVRAATVWRRYALVVPTFMSLTALPRLGLRKFPIKEEVCRSSASKQRSRGVIIMSLFDVINDIRPVEGRHEKGRGHANGSDKSCPTRNKPQANC